MENMSVTEVKLLVKDLEIGMYVCKLDKPWVESGFLFQGFLIKDKQILRQLHDECSYAYIDVAKQSKAYKAKQTIATKNSESKTAVTKPKKVKKKKSRFFSFNGFGSKAKDNFGRDETNLLSDIVGNQIAVDSIRPPEKLASFEQEIAVAQQTHFKTHKLVKEFMGQVKEGGTIDMLVAKQAVQECMGSVLRSPDAMLLMTHLKSKHRSSWQHSMNTGILAISLGRHLNLSDEELTTLGLCGMLHDIGKLLISKQDLLESSNKRALVESHTLLGRDVLVNCHGELARIVAEVAYSHHERLDGRGFPQGLNGSKISPYTRMITIVDTYDVLITDRSGRKGLTHYDAINKMLQQVGSFLDETLVNCFNQCIGTYPAGSIVEMNTGELAIVVEANSVQKLRPKVLILTGPNKESCRKHLVNLAKKSFDANENPYAIRSIIRPEVYGIEIDKYDTYSTS